MQALHACTHSEISNFHGFAIALEKRLQVREKISLLPEKLGEGAFGEVCMCVSGTSIAKVYRKGWTHYLSDIFTEILALHVPEMRHPHLIRGCGMSLNRKAETLTVFMNYGGINLKQWFEEQESGLPSAYTEVLRTRSRKEVGRTICEGILSGLQHIHSLDLVHGDLKDANIMIDRNAHVRIGDLALVAPNAKKVITTRWNRAPEVICRRPWSFPVDIWALGCLLGQVFMFLWRNPCHPLFGGKFTEWMAYKETRHNSGQMSTILSQLAWFWSSRIEVCPPSRIWEELEAQVATMLGLEHFQEHSIRYVCILPHRHTEPATHPITHAPVQR